jgi:hypothetical protein
MENNLVGLLTLEQKDSLVGKLFDADSYFNPVQDIDENWVISTEEINGNIYPEFDWVKNLPLIEFVPAPYPGP